MKNLTPFPFAALLIFALWACNSNSLVTATPPPYSDDQLALHALVEFFDDLHAGRYEEAARLYGGTYEIMIDHNPSINPENHAALFRNACTINGAQCLQVRTAGLEQQVSSTEFIFLVEFQNDDGSLFVLGPCCVATETDMPPQSLFRYKVVKTPQGEFLVQDMPVYMP